MRVLAKAGPHWSVPETAEEWVPAFAGTRKGGNSVERYPPVAKPG